MPEAKINIMKTLFLLFTTFIAINMISCDSGGKMPEKTTHSHSIKDISGSAWKKLAQKKIYFGHQSVGNNIIDGIKDLMKENSQINLNIVETSNPDDLKIGIFAHSSVGRNENPQSKIDAFAAFMEKGIGDTANIAFFKFCFVDVDAGTDIQKLFNEYKSKMLLLKKQYPKTTFIHFTVPLLKKSKGSFKSLIKKILGKSGGFFDNQHNIKRNEFNDLLRNEFKGKEPVFDLAKIESTFPDGTRSSFSKDGRTYYSLVPDYTHDGGHLNEVGRKIVAEQLLILLANVSK
jgi:hypothetical protein